MADQHTNDILLKHNLRFIGTLGQGGFGKVYKVEDTIAWQFLAVK